MTACKRKSGSPSSRDPGHFGWRNRPAGTRAIPAPGPLHGPLPFPRRRPALEAPSLQAGLELARAAPAGRRSSSAAGGEAGERGNRNQPRWGNDIGDNCAYRNAVGRGWHHQARRRLMRECAAKRGIRGPGIDARRAPYPPLFPLISLSSAACSIACTSSSRYTLAGSAGGGDGDRLPCNIARSRTPVAVAAGRTG